MSLQIRTYSSTDHGALHDLLRDPGVVREYQRLVEMGDFDDPLSHPVLFPGGMWLACDGADVLGFAMLHYMPSGHGPWAHVRGAVRSPHRRRGVGSALLKHVERTVAGIPAERTPKLLAAGAWLPADSVKSFLEGRGYAHWRYWWSMERPLGPVPEIVWPKDIEIRAFDGSEHALEEWTACYNDAFGKRFPSHLATVEEAREIAAGPLFRPEGCLLAWRGKRCVGFCRDTIFSTHGEIDVLGVRADAQGRGLGRALLRWGVAWLQQNDVRNVRLIVDGENESALALYRTESFEIQATRQMWMRSTSPA